MGIRFKSIVDRLVWVFQSKRHIELAQGLAGCEQFPEALAEIQYIFGRYGENVPSTRVPLTLNILAAIVFGRLDMAEEAVASVNTVFRQISRRPRFWRRKNKKYLMAYCRQILEYISYHGEDDYRIILDDLSTMTDNEQHRVSKKLRWMFPLLTDVGKVASEFTP